MSLPLKRGIGTRALGALMPKALGCAPCKAMQKQKEANEEFAKRYGVVRDPRYPKKQEEGQS